MPSELVGIPNRPQKPKEKCPCGQHVTDAPQYHLSWRGRLAGKTDHLQAPHDHPGRRSAKNAKEREVLQIDNGESRYANGGAQLTQCEVSSQRAEEPQKAPYRPG